MNKEIVEIKVLNTYCERFDEEATKFIKEGYQPFGSLQTNMYASTYVQMFVKYKK